MGGKGPPAVAPPDRGSFWSSLSCSELSPWAGMVPGKPCKNLSAAAHRCWPPCSPSPSPAASLAQGWQGTREIKPREKQPSGL